MNAEDNVSFLDGALAIRLAGLCGLVGGCLFFAGDMLMYGHFGSAANFQMGALAAIRKESLAQLYVGGLIGPIAACLCVLGFWHVYRNMRNGRVSRGFLVLSASSMVMLGAVHVLWVVKGLLQRECVQVSVACTELTAQVNNYWNTVYYAGSGPAYLASVLLAIAVVAGRSNYPRWTLIFNPAVSLLVAPLLAYVPAPMGAPLVGGDANLFIALFFLVSIISTRSVRAYQPPQTSIAT